ncbi:MAG: glycerate kinase [Oscillatoriales cyanobacterium RU_3_3]|nr:glycerate kinase [Oscillatoriales cyanobacterium RU_3_3]NJR24687.1 glycerate kinase [Richelia sp. CSU_2_1]
MDRSHLNPIEILARWTTGDRPIARELELLAVWELADEARSFAFGITAENASAVVETKSDLFFSLIEEQHNFPLNSSAFLETLWNFWLPLALQLSAEKQSLGRTLIQGILGVQGTGKTTLAKILKLILGKLGCSTIGISLDDLYKTYADRQQLQKQDPRLIWRGPPGTHDLDLGVAVLDKLRCSQTGELASVENSQSGLIKNGETTRIEIPRFDKSAWGGSGDRTTPEIVSGADIVLFEGWFAGVRPIEEARLNAFLENAPFPIATEGDRQFARDMNAKLSDYLPLWERLDKLIVLYPQDYRISQVWRSQAEQEAIAAGKSGMTEDEINRFVEYFWKALHPELFIKAAIERNNWVDLAVEIKSDRTVGKIYQPR